MSAVIFRLAVMVSCAIVIVLTGCEHKELCYNHGHNVEIEIRFKWDAAPDADPQTMVVNFFSLDGTHVARREFTSRDGGVVMVEAGEYRLLFHNGEMESVKEAVDNYDKYGLATVEEALLAPMSRSLDTPPRPLASAKEPVRSPAEIVWAGKHEYVMVEHSKERLVVELYPEKATACYTVEVVDVENLRDNLALSAALSGLSEHFNVSSGSAAGQPVTVPFAIERKDSKTLKACFLTFGHCPDDNVVPHILSIYTSNKSYFNFDVTDQVHNAPDDKNIYIRIDGLKLPVGGKDDDLLSVDPWEEVEENIEIIL